MTGELTIPDWTHEDYIHTTKPYEWLYKYIDDKFMLMQLREQIKIKAGAAGVKSFVSLWNAYVDTLKHQKGIESVNVTGFDGQATELVCGEYMCDDFGITVLDKYGFELQVCSHPIMPVKRMVNIDTGEVKVLIAFKRGGIWREMIVDKSTLASAQRITELAKYSVAVDSENARHLVKYFTTVESLNFEKLDEISSVGRLGWIKGHGFSPYVENLRFDGELCFKHMFSAVCMQGDYILWLSQIKKARKRNAITKILLAASFGSILIEPAGALPFFVHLWGGTEAGKTVALMMAASVWANPAMGEYIRTFNATAVGQEITAGFVNSLPLIIDELQIAKDRKSFDDMIYQLTEGVGRSRGAKSGGLQRLQVWRNCIITSGEQPIVNAASFGGAVNRIVEIDCKDIKIFENPPELVEVISKNYGFAGRLFAEVLQDDEKLSYALEVRKGFYEELLSGKSTAKQAMAGSIILAADRLCDEWIFRDGERLSVKDVEQYLVTEEQVNINLRAYEWLRDFVSANQTHFVPSAYGDNDMWGTIDGDWLYINKSIFTQRMTENGFNASAFISWAKRNGILRCDDRRNTSQKRIGNSTVPLRCICVNISEDFFPVNAEVEDDGFPF